MEAKVQSTKKASGEGRLGEVRVEKDDKWKQRKNE